MKEVIVSFSRESAATFVTLRDIDTLEDICEYKMGLVEVWPLDSEEIYLTDIIDAICGAKFKDEQIVKG